MTVSQTDRVPQLTSTPQTEDDSVEEVAPVKQTRKKAVAAPVEDTSDLIKKWADM